MKSVNRYHGIVEKVSLDKTKVTLRLPKGGLIEAKNEGFEIGNQVCFIMDPLGRKVIKVIPKILADVQVLVGSSPELQGALIEPPEDLRDEEDFGEYEYELKEWEADNGECIVE